jgi:hypothetical protein
VSAVAVSQFICPNVRRSGRAPLAAALIVVASVGCGASSQRADDVSAAQRERIAYAELDAAAHERAAYNPRAKSAIPECMACSKADCETVEFNPTTAHLDEATVEMNDARRQLALAQSLRDAEARACASVPLAERGASPLDPPTVVLGAVPLFDDASPTNRTLRGAVLRLHEPVAVSLTDMQNRVACHLAETATRGHVAPEMPTCPFVPRATATVTLQAGEIVILIRGADEASGAEIWARAQRFLK